MRFHVVAFPHTAVSARYPLCGFTQTTKKFCHMMRSLGHEVILYAAEDCDADVTERVVCTETWPLDTYMTAVFDVNAPHWRSMNERAIAAILERATPTDFLCLIAGNCQKPIADALPSMMAVEHAIGYSGIFARYRVFESYAWMHAALAQYKDASTIDGDFFSTVIPHFFDLDLYPVETTKKEDYFLYFGRCNARKGVPIAEEACARIGAKLLLAGPPGDYTPTYGEVLGPVSDVERGKLMASARAIFVPTRYIGPFEGVAVEAMLCGTPAITTDFGAFTETVENGVNGYRCTMLADFCKAAEDVVGLDRVRIARDARAKYDMHVLKHDYDRYFDRLATLRRSGWYEGAPSRPA